MKRLLCIVLILLLLPGMALGEGVALSFTAQDSKLWPQGAAEALNTLLDGMTLTVDDTGVFVRARLDGTEEGRKLYEEIAGGYIDRMSFAFTVREEGYDEESHLWTIYKVKRLYDVSAVDIPAYDDTSIAARRAAVEDSQRARQAALALDKRKLKLKCKL